MLSTTHPKLATSDSSTTAVRGDSNLKPPTRQSRGTRQLLGFEVLDETFRPVGDPRSSVKRAEARHGSTQFTYVPSGRQKSKDRPLKYHLNDTVGAGLGLFADEVFESGIEVAVMGGTRHLSVAEPLFVGKEVFKVKAGEWLLLDDATVKAPGNFINAALCKSKANCRAYFVRTDKKTRAGFVRVVSIRKLLREEQLLIYYGPEYTERLKKSVAAAKAAERLETLEHRRIDRRVEGKYTAGPYIRCPLCGKNRKCGIAKFQLHLRICKIQGAARGGADRS